MLTKLTKLVRTLYHDEGGAMAVEKILLLALISIPVIILIVIFGTKAMRWFTTQDQKLDSNTNYVN